MQGIEHKKKISKDDFHKSTNKGGGNGNWEEQLLNHDVVRFLLYSHEDTAEPFVSSNYFIFQSID